MSTNFKLLHNRTLLTIGLAESISGIGDWVTMMAVFAMLVFRGNGGVAQSSGVFLAGLLPTLVCSPLAGWLADRFDRKLLMIASQLLSGLAVSGLIFATRLEVIYALLALEAISYSIMSPARQAVVPQIVAREDLSRANALLQQLSSIIKIGGPMIAGAVLTVLNPHQAIILDVVSFVLAAITLGFIPSLPPQRSEVSKPTQTGLVKPAANHTSLATVIKSAPALRLVFLTMLFCTLVISGFDVVSSVFVRDVLKANEQFFGFCIGLVGAGTLLATFWLLLKKGEAHPWRDVLLGISFLACIPLVLSAVTLFSESTLARALGLAACLVGGIGNGLLLVQVSTLLQTLTPSAFLGRIGGLFQSTAVTGQLVGILTTPLLVPAVLSMGGYFGISAIALAILVAAVGLQLAMGFKQPSLEMSPVPVQPSEGTTNAKFN